LGLLDITALSATVVSMTVALHKPTGGKTTWLLAPYCAWLGVATWLNAGIVYLNAGRRIAKKD
jgi:benzodiazapine receptor